MQTSAGRGEREKGCRGDRTWFCVATMDGNRTACSCAPGVSVRCPVAVVALTVSVFLCSLFVGHHVARTSVADPCVSVQVGVERVLFPVHP